MTTDVVDFVPLKFWFCGNSKSKGAPTDEIIDNIEKLCGKYTSLYSTNDKKYPKNLEISITSTGVVTPSKFIFNAHLYPLDQQFISDCESMNGYGVNWRLIEHDFESIYHIPNENMNENENMKLMTKDQIKNVCDCVSDEVLEALNTWIVNDCPAFTNPAIQYIFEHMKTSADFKANITNKCNDNLLMNEIYCAIKYIKEHPTAHVSILTFMSKYYDLSLPECSVVLHYLDNIGNIVHGISLRCPWTGDNKDLNESELYKTISSYFNNL